MKSCERYELLASLLLDGETSGEEQAELTEHLEACPGCRAYFEDVKRIHEAFAREETVVPEGFAVRVMDRVRDTEQERPEEEKKVIPFPRWRQWAALAACCAVVALSVWALRGNGGIKGAVAAVGSPPQTSATAQSADHEGPAPLFDDEIVEDDADSAEAAQTVPEEYAGLAKSSVSDGAGEGGCRSAAGSRAEQGPVLASSPPPDDLPEQEDAFPVSETDQESMEPEEHVETEPAQRPEEEGESQMSPAPQAEGADAPAEAVEPVEVIGVPEPGIVTAYGTAAQAWVEGVVGLEWAAGGSYPLTAEQYGDLLRTLDEAGESYSIGPGEDYCLMAE